MASVGYEKSGGIKRYYVQLSPSENPKRPKIRLGNITKREAQSVRVHVEALVQARITGESMPIPTADWLANTIDSIRDRLILLGLIEPEKRSREKVKDWIDNYISDRNDVKEQTKRKWRDVANKLSAFFHDQYIDEVTVRDGHSFRSYLNGTVGLSENTTRKHISIARQFFKVAVDAELIDNNPFAGQAVTVRPNKSREFYITPEKASRVLMACPDAEWRLIFGLARFGGLRCPSEVLELKWEDVDFKRDQFKVRSSKTEHHSDGGVREIPIFPELRPLFRDAYQETGECEYCITRYRSATQNLRTTFAKIIKRAGLEPWPKLFQNLRSTRETELFKLTNGNVKAVCSWLGNSPEVALKHYAQVTDSDMKSALKMAVLDMDSLTLNCERSESGAGSGAQTVHNPVQKVTAGSGNPYTKDAQEEGLEPVAAETCDSMLKGANKNNGPSGTRTPDSRIMSPLL